MSKLFTVYYKTFLRNEIIENEFSENVDLSPADCELMVRNKRCNNFDMICSDTTSCSYEGVRVPYYEWLKQHTGVASPTLREIQEIQPFRRESAPLSSSECSKSVRKPRQLRVFKLRDVV